MQKSLSDLKETKALASQEKPRKTQVPLSIKSSVPLPQVSRKTWCSECKTEIGLVNTFHTEAMASGHIRGAYKCTKCNHVYCLECSDTRIACYCGSQLWQECHYIPLTPDPPFIVDETGETSYYMQNSQTTYLTPQMINLPKNINPRHLNAYLKARMQIEANPDETPKIPVYFLFIFIVIGFSVYQFTNSWGWAIGVGFASYLIIGTLYVSTQKSKKKEWLDQCQQCGKSITITAVSPASAWECSTCGFNHFEYWQRHSTLAQNLRK